MAEKKDGRISHEQKLDLIGGTSGTSGYEKSDIDKYFSSILLHIWYIDARGTGNVKKLSVAPMKIYTIY